MIEIVEMLDISPLGKERVIWEVLRTDKNHTFFDLKGRFLDKKQAEECKEYWKQSNE